ncbi:MAG: hypothetical protein ACPL2N_02000 [Candidatus Cryosericum sp.]
MRLSRLDIATTEQARHLLASLECHVAGIDIMAPKATFLAMRISGLLPQAANILKQEMLAKGGEVAVPSGALRLEKERVDCVVMGTPSQYDQLVMTLQQQPFELPTLAPKLSTFVRLASARPVGQSLGSHGETAVGGLVDCDIQPPGVRDHTANAVALGWHLLEERSDFLVVTGSSMESVQAVARQLSSSAACPVAAWVRGSSPIILGPATPLIIEQGQAVTHTAGPVMALCTGEDSTEFIEQIMAMPVESERLFIAAQPFHGQSGVPAVGLVPGSLPRLDAVFFREEQTAAFSRDDLIVALTRLFEHGTRVFVTDAPQHVSDILKAVLRNQ